MAKLSLVRIRYLESTRHLLPDARILRKRDSLLMKFLSLILFFTKGFLDNYVTTIGSTIYLPDAMLERNDLGHLTVIAHELQHVYDASNNGILFSVGYLFPQILAPLSFTLYLLPFTIAWYVPILVFFALILPWPAPFRSYYEKRGCILRALAHTWITGENSDSILEESTRLVCGAPYYFASWRKKRYLNDLQEAYKKLYRSSSVMEYQNELHKITHTYLKKELEAA